jgi:3',5'-cyclic AMP phosphodiesterase CpdA
MGRRAYTVALVAALALAGGAMGAGAAPRTTVERTIQDCDADNLLEYAAGEEHLDPAAAAAAEPAGCAPDRGGRPYRLPRGSSIFNFLQLSDFQVVDEESPARVEFFDTTQRGPFNPFSAAYRPQESLTTQIAEAMVRQARNATSPVTGARAALSILTGDNADSQQHNETRWFIDILDGTTGAGNPDPEMDPSPGTPERKVDPNSGIPQPGCAGTPGSVYDGVRAGGAFGPDAGYYEPDHSGGAPDREDGDGYSPDRQRNQSETPGRDVTVRDFPGLFEAANEPFEAVGLGMPWYSAFGNHDALVQGNDPNAYVGPFSPAIESSNPAFQLIATGCAKPSHAGNAVLVPPDPRRCFLAKDEPGVGSPPPCNTGGWMQQHSRTTGTPVGHGFDERPLEAEVNNDGYYSFSPREHLRFVVLDSVTDECGAEFCSEGSIDDTQFRWLERKLDKAATAGEYVLAFAHHTLRTTRQPTTDATEAPIHYGQRLDRENPPNPQNVTIGRSLEELFCDHPNVLAFVTGHEHANYVEHRECEADQPPALGPGDFWEVSTAAHIDWPQQARMIELVEDSGELKLVLTILDHAGPASPGGPQPLCRRGASTAGCGRAGDQVLRLASIGREIAYNDYQGGRFTGGRGDRDDRNLIVPLGRPFPCDPGPDATECGPDSAGD